MIQAPDLITELQAIYSDLSPGLQRAALTILDNPNDVAIGSMRSLANKANVSPPTMLRLAQHMGFENYESFRDVFRQNVVAGSYGDRANQLRAAADEGGISGLIAATVGSAEFGMSRFLAPSFVGELERVADILISAKRCYIIASGASFGQAMSFRYVCRMVMPSLEIIGDPGSRLVDEVTTVTSDDAVLAITTSPYAAQTIQASKQAHERGASMTMVTDDRDSPIGKIAGAAIVIETESPHFFPSMISLNATLEILGAVITVKRGKAGLDSIADAEATLKETAYYWRDRNEQP